MQCDILRAVMPSFASSTPFMIQGSELIHAPIDAVWQALHDSSHLPQIVPGCSHIKHVRYQKSVDLFIDSLPAVLPWPPILVRVQFVDVHRPHHYRCLIDLIGANVSLGQGIASIQLQPQNEATALSYQFDVQFEGPLQEPSLALTHTQARSWWRQSWKGWKDLLETS